MDFYKKTRNKTEQPSEPLDLLHLPTPRGGAAWARAPETAF